MRVFGIYHELWTDFAGGSDRGSLIIAVAMSESVVPEDSIVAVPLLDDGVVRAGSQFL